MYPPRDGLGANSTTPTLNSPPSRGGPLRHELPRGPSQVQRVHGERGSETSSDSSTYFANRHMNRQCDDYQPGGGRGNGRAYSNSSESSSGQHHPNRPTVRPAFAMQDRVTPPGPANAPLARPDAPITPGKVQSAFTLNGHQISETYTARPDSLTNSPRQTTPTSTLTRGGPNRYANNRGGPRTAPRPVVQDGEKDWAYQQEYKIKLLRVPKACWTKEIHQALTRYGNVVRIEMQPSARDNNAWVVFQ